MRFSEFSDEKNLLETGMVFARVGKTGGKVQTKQKFSCSSGPRAGKRVSSIAQCFAPLDIKQSVRLKQTKKKLGSKMARKSRKTKRTNPASRRLKQLNRS